jgi:hypothetical protein
MATNTAAIGKAADLKTSGAGMLAATSGGPKPWHASGDMISKFFLALELFGAPRVICL